MTAELVRGEFRFLVPLAKASEGADGKWFVEGVASDTGLDLQEERISVKGQESMVAWAKAGTVALGGEANHFQIAFDDDLGYLVDGHVNEAAEFYIKAELDKGNTRAKTLYNQLKKKGKKLGLSVFGKITEFHDEGGTPVIDGVELTRVMVTPYPANPRTWLEYVGKALTGAEPEEENMDKDPTDNVAKKIVDVDEWDGSASRWETTEDYCADCLIDVNEAAGREEKAQSHCKLPVRGPDDDADTYVRQAVHAAAGGYGITRVKRPDDVPQEDWDKAVKSAANELIDAYNEMDEVAPDAVYELAGKEPPDEAAKSEPEPEQEPIEAVEEGQFTVKQEGDDEEADTEVVPAESDEEEEEEPATEEPENPEAAKEDPPAEDQEEPESPAAEEAQDGVDREVAKGAFLDALRQRQEAMEAQGPFDEQLDRIAEIESLLWLLWDVAEKLYWDGDPTMEEIVAVLREAIEEFKAEVAAKAAPPEAQDGTDSAADDTPTVAKEEDEEEDREEDEEEVADDTPTEEEDGAEEEDEEGAQDVAKDDTAEDTSAPDSDEPPTFRQVMQKLMSLDVPASEEAAPAAVHPATQVANSFAQAVSLLLDQPLSPDEQREAVGAALAVAADSLDEALPAPDTGEEMPAWARILLSKVEKLEDQIVSVNVPAGSAVTPPETEDRPTLLPTRKSKPPALRPSAVVEKANSFRDIVKLLYYGGEDEPLQLP